MTRRRKARKRKKSDPTRQLEKTWITVVWKTPRAVLINYEGYEEWLPLSLACPKLKIAMLGDSLDTYIPLWWLQAKGWIAAGKKVRD